MSLTLLSSPLQGLTDYIFRNALHKYFGGIDTFYSPYIHINDKLKTKNLYERDLLPEHNSSLELIPQVITKKASEFLYVVKYIQSLGYKELNWNLGCPYPMVIKRGIGSGLINNPKVIDHILKRVHSETNIKVSIKMRTGYKDNDEILKTLPVLDKYPLKSIAIHARLGKQLYKGDVDFEAFQRCIDNTKHKLYYNGDISTVANFKTVQERFPTIDHFMIGRGLIADPFLPSMIKANTTEYPSDRFQRFSEFHDTIYHQYGTALSGPTPIKMKMLGFWEYFSESFENPKKTYKKIKKAGNQKAYQGAVKEILYGR